MERKKILFVITKSNFGGAQKYVYELAAAFHERHDISVALGGHGTLRKKLDDLGVRTIEIPGLKRNVGLWDEWQALRSLVHLFRNEQPDIVHLNSSKAGVLGAVAARWARVPHIVFTVHAFAFNEDRPWWQKVAIWMLHWITLLLSHRIIAVSRPLAQDAAAMPLTRGKIHTIHHGLAGPLPRSRTDARARLTSLAPSAFSNGEPFLIGIVGELHPIKGHRYALAAMQKIAPRFPSAHLLLIGEGDLETPLQTEIRNLNLETRVTCAGYVEAAGTLMKGFDLLLIPSLSEALAYVALEAGRAGIPVIASNVGGLPDIIEDQVTGLLISPKDSSALARAMQTLMEDERLRQRLGDALQQKIEREFDFSQMIRATEEVYLR